MRLRLTEHAKDMLMERELELPWLERALAGPIWTEPDRARPGVYRAFMPIPEAGDRILRVAYIDRAGERIVLTLHFDRNARRRYKRTDP